MVIQDIFSFQHFFINFRIFYFSKKTHKYLTQTLSRNRLRRCWICSCNNSINWLIHQKFKLDCSNQIDQKCTFVILLNMNPMNGHNVCQTRISKDITIKSGITMETFYLVENINLTCKIKPTVDYRIQNCSKSETRYFQIKFFNLLLIYRDIL